MTTRQRRYLAIRVALLMRDLGGALEPRNIWVAREVLSECKQRLDELLKWVCDLDRKEGGK